MKILFIALSFPPGCGASGITAWKIASLLSRKGHSVSVLCPGSRAIERSPWFNNKLQVLEIPLLYNTRQRPLRNLMGMVTNRFIDFPASYAGLISSAYKTANNELIQSQYDVMITWADPVASHVVGAKLKGHFAHLPWIVNFTDPWPSAILPSPYRRRKIPILHRHQVKCMSQIMYNAEMVVIPCERMKNHMLK